MIPNSNHLYMEAAMLMDEFKRMESHLNKGNIGNLEKVINTLQQKVLRLQIYLPKPSNQMERKVYQAFSKLPDRIEAIQAKIIPADKQLQSPQAEKKGHAKDLMYERINLKNINFFEWENVVSELTERIEGDKKIFSSAKTLSEFYVKDIHQNLRKIFSSSSSVVLTERFEQEVSLLEFLITKYQNVKFSLAPAAQKEMIKVLHQAIDCIEKQYEVNKIMIPPAQQGVLNQCKELLNPLKITEPESLPMPEEPFAFAGQRTIGMINWLKNFAEYDSKKKKFLIGEKEFQPISGVQRGFSQMPVASCGSTGTREILTLDPFSSNYLPKYYEGLKKEIDDAYLWNGKKTLTSHQMLKIVNQFVRNMIFPSCLDENRDLESELTTFINAKRKAKKECLTYKSKDLTSEVPVIPIDEFIKRDIAVCRHHALVTAYLIERLTLEEGGKKIPNGIILVMRDAVPGGAHVWTVFNSNEGERFILDTLWNVCKTIPDNEAQLRLSYGNQAINHVKDNLAAFEKLAKL